MVTRMEDGRILIRTYNHRIRLTGFLPSSWVLVRSLPTSHFPCSLFPVQVPFILTENHTRLFVPSQTHSSPANLAPGNCTAPVSSNGTNPGAAAAQRAWWRLIWGAPHLHFYPWVFRLNVRVHTHQALRPREIDGVLVVQKFVLLVH